MARNLVNLEDVHKSYGTSDLLDGVSLGIAEGERIGVVGVNGGGKTTLLRVLTAREDPDAGRVTHVGGLELGLLTQQDELVATETVRVAVLGSRAAHDWAGDAAVRDVLTGLFGGLDLPGLPHGLDSTIAPLSGGERRRVALARLLVGEHDLLVLDEPTNHLDVEGITWLAGHLRTRRSALVVVTHDRWFLDEVCDTTWEVSDGGVHAYEGGYSAYVLARAERQRIAAGDEARRQNLMRKELAWLRRGPPARTSKPQFRIDAANALVADEPPARDTVTLQRFASARLGKIVYDLEHADLEVGGRTLLHDLTWQVGPGDRFGIVGVNGAGKTSLLRLLLGEIVSPAGRVVTGTTVRAGYLSQQVAELPGSLRVLEAVEDVRRVMDLGGGRTMTASQLCERFGFGRTKQWTPVRDLSGGERRRLQLLRLLMDEPNVLMFDEPTNDLDIDTLTALEDLLDGWPGSLLVVSHDRYFLERVCDRTVALLGDGTMLELPGGLDDYLARRRVALDSYVASERPASPATPVRTGDLRQARKDLSRIEKRVTRLDQLERDVHAAMAEHASDYARVAELDTQLRELTTERESLEEQWMVTAELVGD